MSWHDGIRRQLAEGLASRADNEINQLNNALRLLAKHRSVLIQNTLIQNEGLSVLQGPLAGLEFISQSAEGCHIAKLLGCYEQPLQTHVEAAMDADYDAIINIGCAEGYYAVGMARKLKKTKTYAYDTNEEAQHACKELAEKNGVSDRVEVGAYFSHADFENFEGRKTFLFCDIEGAEVELLDPKFANSLTSMDIIVEAHEGDRPGTVSLLIERFKETHSIEFVGDDGQRNLGKMPQWFMNLSHLDQLLATWEWRSGPTPWLVMKSKSHQIK